MLGRFDLETLKGVKNNDQKQENGVSLRNTARGGSHKHRVHSGSSSNPAQ